MEIWKNVKGFEGLYQVSSLGRIKSLQRTVKGKRKGHKVIYERILKPLVLRDGYLQVQLANNGKIKKMSVHRIVAINFIENPLNKKNVNHINGIKSDNRIENLEWVTSRENSEHAVKIGLIDSKGEKHKCSKLTKDQVLKIKYGLKNLSQNQIAKMFNTTQANISLIRTNKNWSHV